LRIPVQEREMKHTTLLAAALLTGAIAFAQAEAPSGSTAGANAGGTTASGGVAAPMAPSTGVTNEATSNAQANGNAAVGNSMPQAGGNTTDTATADNMPGKKMAHTANRATRHAQANGDAAEEETTRQLNQQASAGAAPPPVQ
jgi:hypothetical protein